MDDKKIKFSKGGGHTPVESPNTLQSKTIARLVDLLCEGPIEGPAIHDNDTVDKNRWMKSTFFNETQVKENGSPDAGTLHFKGATVEGRYGEGDGVQTYLRGFDSVDTETTVSTDVTVLAGPVTRTINDTEVDDVVVTIQVGGLLENEDDGDIVPTSIRFNIKVTPDGGAPVTVRDVVLSKEKTVSKFRRQYLIENLVSYGAGPWDITVTRITADSDSSRLVNAMSWYSYSTKKNVRLSYMDSVVVGSTLDAALFGDNIPYRCWKLRGLLIKYPDIYTPDKDDGGGTYSDDWDTVSWSTGYCTNPAWVVYDFCINTTYGLGLPPENVDHYKLYEIAQYCDQEVSYNIKYRQTDGTYLSTAVTEPRFTANGTIESRGQALKVLYNLCSIFRGFPIWSSGYLSFVYDAPTEVSRIASPSNVKDGYFEYQGVDKTLRYTACKVTYNDIDNFSKQETVIVEDEAGISLYGYNVIDFYAVLCKSRNEAIRRAKYHLYTSINQTEIVTFNGGYEWSDCIPGEVIGIQDPYYGSDPLRGKVVSATSTSVTLDRNVTIAPAVTYTLHAAVSGTDGTSENVVATILTKELTNSAGTTKVLTWSIPADHTPANESEVVIAASNSSLTYKEFKVVSIAEVSENEYTISACEYNSSKYAEIETGYTVENPADSNLPTGNLSAPSNLQIQPYTYTDGDSQNRKYAMLISWEESDDPRTEWYELEYKQNNEPYIKLKQTRDSSYDWRNIYAGTYDFRVRARNLTLFSTYAYFNDFTVTATVDGPLPPSNLRTNEGSDEFSGRDCHVLWDPSDGSGFTTDDNTGVIIFDTTSVGTSNIVGYKVEVYTTVDVLLRTFTTASKYDEEYVYTYAMNVEDNSGTPIREIKFKVYTMDVYGDTSDPATMVASNPAPDMSSTTPTVTPKTGYLKVEWTPTSDNDMEYYKVYIDTSNPPTTEVARIIHPDNIFEFFDVEYGTTYYVKVYPYDGFGVGTPSVIPGGQSPLLIPAVNVDVELEGSITITTDASYSGTLTDVYDGVFASGGVTISDPSSKYIDYAYKMTSYFDRIAIWSANANPIVYFALSDDAGSTWEYFAGYSAGELTSYGTSQANAISNAWNLSAGFNTGLLPNNTIANQVRIYFTNANETIIYEFVPSRIIISELAAIESLSAISADIGTITAGNIQTSDYGSATGMNIDLDAKTIYMGGSNSPIFSYDDDTRVLNCTGTFVFSSGSTGYSNITDAPTSLSEIDSTASLKLDGIDDYATNNASWEHADDQTKIDGGKLYVGSTIKLQEGGQAEFGDKNVIIDTQGNHGSIVVSEDGGPEVGDYCVISDGGIDFYILVGGEHYPYKSLNRVETGTAANGTWTTIPGYFKYIPEVIVSPASLQTYSVNYPTQSQSLRMEATQIQETSAGSKRYKFYTQATLELSEGSTGGVPVNDTESRYVSSNSSLSSWATLTQSPTITNILPNTRQLTVNLKTGGYTWDHHYATKITTYKDGSTSTRIGYYTFYSAAYTIRLWVYLVGSGWTYVDKYVNPGRSSSSVILSYSMGYSSTQYDIGQFYTQWFYSGLNSGVNVNGTTTVDKTYELLSVVSYSSNQVDTAILATGNLNWMAIGS